MAQSPTDALMMKKNELCIAAIYQHDTWDHYWEGTLLRDNQNIGTLTRNNIVPMIAYGLTQKLNVIISLPYISTSASGGQSAGVSGFQDFSIFAKYKVLDIDNPNGSFQAFATGGYSLPSTNYLSDYMPLNLGLGTNELSLRAILKYEHKSGLYLRGSFAYLYRTTTEAERSYYYADKGIYTTTMDVPNATVGEAALGMWLLGRSIQLEAAVIKQTAQSGDDIRRQNAPQPTNKMNVSNANASLRFFPKFIKGFSIITGFTKVLEGRNIGKSTIISGGLTYQFNTKKQTAQ
ncbi:MAG: transporter [Saprospiraceae bacterium]|nr:transporter [Saprospiraceae bacterium]